MRVWPFLMGLSFLFACRTSSPSSLVQQPKPLPVLSVQVPPLASANPEVQAPSTPVVNPNAHWVLGLRREGCWGGCPAYELRFYESGRVEIRAQANLPRLGTWEFDVDAAKLAALLRESQAFKGFPSQFPVGVQAPSLPASHFFWPDTEQRLTHVYDGPQRLQDWENALYKLWYEAAFDDEE